MLLSQPQQRASTKARSTTKDRFGRHRVNLASVLTGKLSVRSLTVPRHRVSTLYMIITSVAQCARMVSALCNCFGDD